MAGSAREVRPEAMVVALIGALAAACGRSAEARPLRDAGWPERGPPDGGWIETPQVKLRLAGISSCAPTPGEARRWVGMSIEARTKAGALFVTARDFSLEQGGIVVPARHVSPPLLAGCLPLLQARQLPPRQTTHGFVLFEVPARLRAFAAGSPPVVLAYRPTVWGGARRLEMALPACLDDCPPAPRHEATAPRASADGRR